ncbi:M10 family metallopeptidase C-terminal domain-containing protein [Microcystis sp. CS-574]|uniref:bluetail domain-containing putative surface protein n=1 Tax=Microcystis sp. CS-574 TaxID=3021718 RepID=UPI00232C620D|nr:bluetail domain-containing putative surface protein [Microcystis sp. CS-574]MDB9406332.1 M10 family metallopeptidase C-terminal domain-containing protein [Microcystis sp. CS-574]
MKTTQVSSDLSSTDMPSLEDSLSFDGAFPITFDLTGSDDLTVSRETPPLGVLNSDPSPSTVSSEAPTVPVSPAATSQVVFPASLSIDSSGYLTSPAPSPASVPTTAPVTTSPGLGLVSVPTAEGWDSRVNQDNLTQKTGETHITYCYSCGQYHSSKLGLQPLSSLSPNAPQGTRDYLLPPKTVNYSSLISVIENTISIKPRNTPIPKFATVNTQGSFDFTSISNAEVFNLSSNPFSSKTIYLDFDGYNTSATAWNATSLGADRISSIAVFSLDSIVSTAYSQAEFDAIKEIFRRVAADYAPFGVNVTTKTPTFDQITRSSTSDSAYGTVVSIGNIGSQWSGAGGIAYVGIYDLVDTTNYYKPALVFPSRLGTAKNIAEAASHEAGHNLNLSHDGQGSTEYYTGGGSSPGWAPIMGVGYSKQLTQFSRGQYSNATNTENDFLQIRGEGIGRYVEGTPNTDLASAQTITLNSTGYGGAFEWITLASDDGNTGIDYDYFKFTAPAAGSVNISVNNALIFSKDGTNFIGEDLPAGYGNLHLDAQILNASGGVLADWNNNALVDVTGLTYSGLVAGQNYFVKVGPNSTLPDQSFGETTWGSLGAYALRIQADTKSISIAKTTDGNEAGSVSSVFTLTRTGDLSSALTVNYTLAGTATPGVDYTGTTPSSVTFAAGSSKATIILPTKDDLLSDPSETIITKITAPVGYTISGPDNATATILDNDGNAANNNLVGTSFADALAGVGGNDTLSGLGGNDTLDGGADNDTYLFDTDMVLGSDRLIDASGIDTLNFAATTTKTINLNLGSTAAQTVTAGNLTLTLASATAFENVIGGSLNDNIVGNTLNNSLTGGLGKDSLTGSTGLDTLNYNSLGESLLSGFDVIQGYSGTGASLDRINAPAPIAPITLTASKGTATALTEAAIQLVLTNAAFAANTAAAFKVTGQSGTFIALNNGAAGFQAASDAIIQLSGYNIAAATPVVVI